MTDNRIILPEAITEIQGDKAFPIFKLEAHLSYNGVENDCVFSSRMYKALPSAEQTFKDLEEWWQDFINKEPLHGDGISIVQKHPVLLSLNLLLTEYETWCIRWFSHYTYVDGRSDEELLQSFYRFRDRKLPLHYKEKYCLMGAENIWRFSPPCHCEECEKLGITHIVH